MLTPPFDLARPDLCVLGGGTAGHALAVAAAAIGLRCTVVDPRERLGAGQAADLVDSVVFGATARRRDAHGTGDDWDALAKRAATAAGRAAPEHAAARLRTLGIAVVAAEPRFVDARTIAAGSLAIRARRFVIATGAVAAPLSAEAPGADPCAPLTPGDLLRRRPPDRLVIVTAQPRGLPWAQALARHGVLVRVLASPATLDGVDPELAGFVLAGLRRDGVALDLADGPEATAQAARVAELVLSFPAGRPATAGLDLGRAGVGVDARGAPVADAGFRTGNRRVFAIGDVLGVPRDRAVAPAVGAVLRAVAAGLPARSTIESVPRVLRTDPPVAQVGTLDLGALGDGARLWRAPAAAGSPAGEALAKVATDRRNRVVGAGVVGAGAAEAIGAAALAVAGGLPVGVLADALVGGGPAADALRRAALAAVADGVRRPAIKRLIALRQRLP